MEMELDRRAYLVSHAGRLRVYQPTIWSRDLLPRLAGVVCGRVHLSGVQFNLSKKARMKNLLILSIKAAGLALTLLPAFLAFTGHLAFDTNKKLMLLGFILWFGPAFFKPRR